MIRDINLNTVTLWPLICDLVNNESTHTISHIPQTDTLVSKTERFSS